MVVARTLADWPIALAAWLLLVAAVTLLVAGTLYADAVALGGLRRAVADASAVDRTVDVRTYVERATMPATAGNIEAALFDALGPSTEVRRVVRAGSLTRVIETGTSGQSSTPPADLLAVASYEAIDRHATLEDGAWPRSGERVTEAAIRASAATALGLRPGDEVALSAGGAATAIVRVRIVGTWRPNEDDPYWSGGALELDGATAGGATTTRGPLVVTEADLLALVKGDVDMEWRGLPPPAAITLDGAGPLVDRLAVLPARLREVLPADRQVQVGVGLGTVVAQAHRSGVRRVAPAASLRPPPRASGGRPAGLG
jgi:hypothetical protein